VAYYLALCAYDDGPWRPLAVTAGGDVVGFVMWGQDPADGSFWIGGLVIDRHHQRRGYGRQVVRQLLERAAAGGYRSAALSYDPRNTVARALYASLGFQENRRGGGLGVRGSPSPRLGTPELRPGEEGYSWRGC
jgi:diamine N-acetyltransferase